MTKAECREGYPQGKGKHLAEGGGTAGWVEGRVGEREGAEEANSWIEEREDISPSNIGSWAGCGSRVEEDAVAEFDDVSRSGSVAVPE